MTLFIECHDKLTMLILNIRDLAILSRPHSNLIVDRATTIR